MRNRLIFFCSGVALIVQARVMAQHATVYSQTFKTYPYSDPNPIPVLGINKKVAPFYPYYTFDGYTEKAINQEWKIVKLENAYIIVYVAPGLGGKVLGAIEKASGNEFVYLNHVVKFRAIGIRGPWTSGGIEHNFGLDLGHAPWAAADVDYVVQTNSDSSVSCIVGGIDLASRSEWRVNIRLPKDNAYFETESFWYNPSPLHHAYLSWENAAFKASDDLQFYFPGTHHIGHDGLASPWPIDNKRLDLSFYRNNNFGESKSYHVVGNYRNWFGGYWHDRKFGFGHWAPYADAPGKKLWIWSLAREGAIWENLLTDNDGQYIEAQSGVTLNQAAERSGYHSPFMQLSHRPHYAETKREYWFPVKNTGGIVDANPFGTLNVINTGTRLSISISPNVTLNDSLIVSNGGQIIYRDFLQLQPMQSYNKLLELNNNMDITVRLEKSKLFYASDPEISSIKRPFNAPADDQVFTSSSRFFRMAEDQNSMRNYDKALEYYQHCLAIESTNIPALCRVAEYYYRSGDFEQGIVFAKKALAYNTYDAAANFIYGYLLKQMQRYTEAEEAFSMATRELEYRSAAFTSLANLNLLEGNFDVCLLNSEQALLYNNNNLLAWQYTASAYRHLKHYDKADSIAKKLLNIDPLNHYARFENYLRYQTTSSLKAFTTAIVNELPHETYLELASTYVNTGLIPEAIEVLKNAPANPVVYLWLAYYTKDLTPGESQVWLELAISASPNLVFPFRPESVPVLQWAMQKSTSWKLPYYLGLVYWNNLQADKAKDLFKQCGQQPDFAPFYLARAALFQNDSLYKSAMIRDYERALKLQPSEWRTWHYLQAWMLAEGQYDASVNLSKQAYKKFTGNPIVAMDYAKSLLHAGALEACLEVLRKVLVLPQEGAQEGHQLYELANLMLAEGMIKKQNIKRALTYLEASRQWPENLGSGSPYNPDNRLADLMSAYCEQKLNNTGRTNYWLEKIKSYSMEPGNWNSPGNAADNYISAMVLRQSGNNIMAEQLLAEWKNTKDSLRNWSITQGSDMPEVQWVLMKYHNEKEKTAQLEKQIINAGIPTRFRVLLYVLKAFEQ